MLAMGFYRCPVSGWGIILLSLVCWGSMEKILKQTQILVEWKIDQFGQVKIKTCAHWNTSQKKWKEESWSWRTLKHILTKT